MAITMESLASLEKIQVFDVYVGKDIASIAANLHTTEELQSFFTLGVPCYFTADVRTGRPKGAPSLDRPGDHGWKPKRYKPLPSNFSEASVKEQQGHKRDAWA
ncbi:hypothetical protein HXX76_016230 [Chlamydomonas incerta]|uniref:Uncharacterized protein n=1 Tax=Chlamydomonas incerta TaxID=51695 RepID=A0A835SLI0_CHLIN|nr:hypothetical protein HXX76_016230 [Chlamydomonas incerta]|eukprot:KAG2422181.1 hypothetical protein HXX76_016230 [Chlamydomonas incerta]